MKSAFTFALLGLVLACGMPSGVSGQSRGGSGPRVAAPTGRASGRPAGPRSGPSHRRGSLPPFAPGLRSPFVGRAHHPVVFSSPWFGLVAIDPYAVWGPGLAEDIPPEAFLPPVADDRPLGGLQLDVEPRRAQVFVDGAYVGRVEEFSGYYQHLDLPAGPHTIEMFEAGYDPLATYVVVSPGKTATYRGTMNRSSGAW